MNETAKVSYTMEGAAAATGFTRSRLYKAIADGTLRTIKAGRRRMVSRKALEDYVARLERESARGAA